MEGSADQVDPTDAETNYGLYYAGIVGADAEQCLQLQRSAAGAGVELGYFLCSGDDSNFLCYMENEGK